MDALIWGPVTWNFLHLLSISYPDKPSKNDIENNKTLINTLGNILPCLKCRDHFKNNLQNTNMNNELSSKTNYMTFLWNLHNKINLDTNKNSLPYNDFLKEYQTIIDKGHFNPIEIYKENQLLRKILIVISIILFCTILYYLIMLKKERYIY